jgi:hypothetical protein
VGGVDAHVLGEEAAERVEGGVRGDQVAAADPEPALHLDDQEADDHIPDGLVQERRLEGSGRGCRPVGMIDPDAPGKRGPPAVQLLVEVVAKAADGLGQGERRSHAVEQGSEAEAGSVGAHQT